MTNPEDFIRSPFPLNQRSIETLRNQSPRIKVTKLTHFFDTLLRYDLKRGRETKNVDDRPFKFATPSYSKDSSGRPMQASIGNLQSKGNVQNELLHQAKDSNNEISTTQLPKVSDTQGDRNPQIQNGSQHKEADSVKAEVRLEDYIAATWEKYRKRYEHLGEKNPFAAAPPTPDFLLKNHGYSSKHNRHESPCRDENKTTSRMNGSQNSINRFISEEMAHSNDTNDTPNILEEHTVEPSSESEDVEEQDCQSESISELDNPTNNDDNFIQLDEEAQIAEEVNDVQDEECKQSTASEVEEHEVEVSNEYDEVNKFKLREQSMKNSLPDVRSLSTNEGNYHPKSLVTPSSETKTEDGEPNQSGRFNRSFRKTSKRPQRHTGTTGTLEPIRPLVNPYFIPPLGPGAMMPPNPLYTFQPHGMPFNYWMAKPPLSQFNMFPYGYPWPGFPYSASYFQPFFQQNMAPPYLGSPIFRQQTPYNFLPPSQTVPNQGQMQDRPFIGTTMGSEFEAGKTFSTAGSHSDKTDEHKENYKQVMRKDKPQNLHFQRPEFNFSFSGQRPQHQQFRQGYVANNFQFQPHMHQSWSASNDPVQYTYKNEKHFKNVFYPTDFGPNVSPDDSRVNPLSPSLIKPQVQTTPSSSPMASNYNWQHNQPNVNPSWQNTQGSSPFLSKPSPPSFYPHLRRNNYEPHLQQRISYPLNQDSAPKQDFDGTEVNENNELSTPITSEEPLSHHNSYYSRFNDPSKYSSKQLPTYAYNGLDSTM